jgi:hypothetical protein
MLGQKANGNGLILRTAISEIAHGLCKNALSLAPRVAT